MTLASGTAQDDALYPKPAYAWTVAGILGLGTIFALIDRQLPNLLVDPLKSSLLISDSQFALIQGLAFVIFYTVVGIPIGRMVDRSHRPRLLLIGLILWSLMTVLSGFATNFWQLFAARAGVGIGEAVLAPAGFSLMADYFPARKRGRAMAAVAMCSTLGTAGSFLLGAAVLQVVPGDATVVLPVLGAIKGWQLAFFVAGAPGFLIALLLLLIREVPRKETAGLKQEQVDWSVVGAFMKVTWPALFCMALSAAMLNMGGVALVTWAPTYYIRELALPAPEVALILGVLTLIMASSGGLIGGWLSDKLAAWRVGGRIYVQLILATCGLPMLLAWPLVTNVPASFAVYCAGMIWTIVNSCIVQVAISEIVPNRLRGLILGAYSMFTGIFAVGLAPLVVALVREGILGGQASVGWAIVIVWIFTLVIGGLAALAGLRPYARARQAILTSLQADVTTAAT